LFKKSFTGVRRIIKKVGPMSLSKQKLAQIKGQLITRREELVTEIRQGTSEMIEEDPFCADSLDQAAADMDRGLAVQMKNRERELLAEIDTALRRLESGTFGDCSSCGEEVGEMRMRAKPSTTLCITCQAELESERGRIPRWA
jgi:DnaK suppressor protein